MSSNAKQPTESAPLTDAERETVRHCPECGHDWSGHPDDPTLAAYFPCRGQRGLGSVSGCRCTLTLAGHVVALVAAARAEADHLRDAMEIVLDGLPGYVNTFDGDLQAGARSVQGYVNICLRTALDSATYPPVEPGDTV